MRSFIRTLFLLCMFAVTAAPSARAQEAVSYGTGQLDQLVAPIALFPDSLLGQVMMASTYPLEVVEAQRWRAQNASLSGDALSAALEQQPWDPSVKALTAFPNVLDMMNNNLEWTENLGEAFLADQRGMMDAVQNLREQAQSLNRLPPPTQETVVADNDGTLEINPTQPDTLDVPWYNPSVVFAPWPYPDYTPYYFQPPFYSNYGTSYYFFGPPVFVNYVWWGGDKFDWRHHHIHIDTHKWRELSHNDTPPPSGVWEHNPAHREGVPFANPALRARFQTAPAAAARENRGFTTPAAVTPAVSSPRTWQEQTGGHAPTPRSNTVQQQNLQDRLNEERTQRHMTTPQETGTTGYMQVTPQRREEQQQRVQPVQEPAVTAPAVTAPAVVEPRVQTQTPRVSAHENPHQENGYGYGDSRRASEPTSPLFESFPSAQPNTAHGSFGAVRAPEPSPVERAPQPREPAVPEPPQTQQQNQQGGNGHGH